MPPTAKPFSPTAKNAVLTWEYFDIGPKTVVIFDQHGHADWTAINRVDGTGRPSEIAGQLIAGQVNPDGTLRIDGTLGLFNPNGFIFRAGSQTTAHTVIASSLDINSNTHRSSH
jgi:filamentous hemagglutinin family protein